MGLALRTSMALRFLLCVGRSCRYGEVGEQRSSAYLWLLSSFVRREIAHRPDRSSTLGSAIIVHHRQRQRRVSDASCRGVVAACGARVPPGRIPGPSSSAQQKQSLQECAQGLSIDPRKRTLRNRQCGTTNAARVLKGRGLVAEADEMFVIVNSLEICRLVE